MAARKTARVPVMGGGDPTPAKVVQAADQPPATKRALAAAHKAGARAGTKRPAKLST